MRFKAGGAFSNKYRFMIYIYIYIDKRTYIIYIYSLNRMHLFNLFCSTSTFVRLQSVSIMWVLGERQSFGDMLLYIWNFQPGVVLATRHRKEEMCKAMQGDFFVIAGDHWAVYLIIWVWKSIIHLPTKAAYTQMFCATLITKRQQGLWSQWFFANIDMNHTFPSTKSKRNESCISTI